MSNTEYYAHYYWTGSLAVDGVIPNDTNSLPDCECCSSTTHRQHNWFTLDLLQVYTIQRVIIKGRPEANRKFGSSCFTPR